jgi:hypothetical protein
MKTVFSRTEKGDTEHQVSRGQRIALCINGYDGDFIIDRVYKNGKVTVHRVNWKNQRFEFTPNSEGKTFLPII